MLKLKKRKKMMIWDLVYLINNKNIGIIKYKNDYGDFIVRAFLRYRKKHRA